MNLREALAKKRAYEQTVALQEAKQLFESYYLIAEKLDTTTISRIVDSMSAVEDALSEFLPKLKSIQLGLDSAEIELTNLVSGKAGNDPKKTGAMLGKAMGFYQHLSAFLRQDLPVLLRSRIFAAAKNSPESPVGAKVIPAFQQALQQEKTGGFLKKLFASSNIPYVDNNKFAQELSTLSFAELEKLSKIGRVPAVMPQTQIDQLAAQAAKQTATPETTPATDSGTQAKVAKALAPWITDPEAVAAVMKALT